MENVSDQRQQPLKKRKIWLKKKQNASDVSEERFGAISKEALEDLTVPRNLALNSQWAMTNICDWLDNYNKRNIDDPCPSKYSLHFVTKNY